MKVRCAIRLLRAEEFLWLTNPLLGKLRDQPSSRPMHRRFLRPLGCSLDRCPARTGGPRACGKCRQRGVKPPSKPVRAPPPSPQRSHIGELHIRNEVELAAIWAPSETWPADYPGFYSVAGAVQDKTPRTCQNDASPGIRPASGSAARNGGVIPLEGRSTGRLDGKIDAVFADMETLQECSECPRIAPPR